MPPPGGSSLRPTALRPLTPGRRTTQGAGAERLGGGVGGPQPCPTLKGHWVARGPGQRQLLQEEGSAARGDSGRPLRRPRRVGAACFLSRPRPFIFSPCLKRDPNTLPS